MKEFEREFASYCGSDHCIAMANGTDAMELVLRAAGVIRGDKVITVENAGCCSTTAMMDRGVAGEVHYTIPDHRQPALAPLCGHVSLPETERACREVLMLPAFLK